MVIIRINFLVVVTILIDGAKPDIEGVNHDIDGAKCQVVKHFVVLSSQI